MTTESQGWRELFAGRNAVYAIILTGGVALHAVNLYTAATVLPSVVNDIGMIANAFGLVDPGGRSGAAQAATALCVTIGFAAALAMFTVRRIPNAAGPNKEAER